MSGSRLTRIAVDVGGTFTDLVAEDSSGRVHVYKSPSTPGDPTGGLLDVLSVAAADRWGSVAEMLASVELLVHGTTRATNAIITGDTARTALLVTKGHPDVLLWREGTRVNTFDYSQQNPVPYIDRALTFEVPERIDAAGEVVEALDELVAIEIIDRVAELEVEAIAVCFLWSVLNGTHERRIGELLDEHLPMVPYTLSHELMPVVREYRRASATSIDASLKPLMTNYLAGVSARLAEAGFSGRLMMTTSEGGVRDLKDVASTPILSIASGPAAAPVAGQYYAHADAEAPSAIVTDAGGTSYDVSLVRNGVIPATRETTVGVSPYGYMTGFTAVDVKSIGAGGGSIAHVDAGGVLHVGPQSAGAVPGPACYGRGGANATVTDACLVMGYLDPGYFLGGRMQLHVSAAEEAVQHAIADRLGVSLDDAAAAVLELQVEHMVSAIEAITLNQGVDPRSAVLIGGGGSAGFYSGAIARRLGCSTVVIPETAAALSAMGALLSDLTAEYIVTHPTDTAAFDYDGVNGALTNLRRDCDTFAAHAGSMSGGSEVRLSAEARYRDQVWELDVPLRTHRFRDHHDVAALRSDFDRTHEEILAHYDPASDVEIVSWHAHVRCRLRERDIHLRQAPASSRQTAHRSVYFLGAGRLQSAVVPLDSLSAGTKVSGPAILESAVTTIVVDPGAAVTRTRSGSVVLAPGEITTSQPGTFDEELA
jgi:N-methylhydantoinase A